MAKIKIAKSKIISFGGIKLPKVNDKGERIPYSFQKIKLPKADKKAIAIGYKNNLAVLLIGETGTGKTSVIRELAGVLKQKYTRISLTGYTTPDELIGSKSVKDGATYYEQGVLTKAMVEGHICVLDELNAITPDTSFIIHGLLDDDKRITLPNGDIITPHTNFRVFATINPDYEGTRTLNKAFLDRFSILIYVNILTPKNEQKLLIERTKITKDIAKKLIAIAWLNRKAYADNQTSTLISTRSLLQTCGLINEGMSIKDAYISAVANKARREEKKAFLDFYNSIFKIHGIDDSGLPVVLTSGEYAQLTGQITTLNNANNQLQNEQFELIKDRANLQNEIDKIKGKKKTTF